MDDFVVLDLETTGLQPKKDRILEIGAIKVSDGQIVDTYETLVNPRMTVPSQVVSLTGITQDMVKDGKENAQAVTEIIDFCQGYPLLGHNILFDYSFLKHSAVNAGIPFEKEGIDTLKIARKALPDLESRGLQYLCSYYGVLQESAHRALDDVKGTFALYQCLKRDFYDLYPKAFVAKPLVYQVKKESPITKFQKAYLIDLLKYHKIELSMEIDSLTKSEASRTIDKIILSYGKIKRGK